MARTPGFVLPSAFTSQQALQADLDRRAKEAGLTPFDAESFAHSDENDDPFVAQAQGAADFLAHYGVKGMKWGRRKTRPDEAARKATFSRKSKSGKVKAAPSDDAQRVGNIHASVKVNKSTRQLSNKELQDAITRMNLEQQYSRMTGGLDKTRRQKAAAFVSELINGTVKNTVQTVAKDQVKDVMEKQTGTGKYDPVNAAKREADIATAKARTRAASAA